MAPAEQDQRAISAEELASWWTPRDALRYAAGCEGISGAKLAANAIWSRLVAGLIEAQALTSSATPKGRRPVPNANPDFIPRHFWGKFSEQGSDLWGAGDVRFFVPGSEMSSGTSTVYRYFGIRLNPADVRATLPSPKPPSKQWVRRSEEATEPAPEVETQPVNKGGRPRKDWWDDFWIDICGQIYEGNLKPQRQADLEKAMLNWATNHGHDLSEATARKVAKKLFVAWKLGG